MGGFTKRGGRIITRVVIDLDDAWTGKHAPISLRAFRRSARAGGSRSRHAHAQRQDPAGRAQKDS